MDASPLPVYSPSNFPSSFRLLLEEIPGFTPRLFRPIRAGRFIVSIQASQAHASTPDGSPPREDVDTFEVTIFTAGEDGRYPVPVTPRSHPHLFRDARWALSWRPGDIPVHPAFWSGHYIPMVVVSDLLTCLVDPAVYAARL
jgi:hypothetical protein